MSIVRSTFVHGCCTVYVGAKGHETAVSRLLIGEKRLMPFMRLGT